MKKIIPAVTLLLVFIGVACLQAEPMQTTTPKIDPTQAELLFVQSAHGARIDGSTLTLTRVSPGVVFFSDRPQRFAGHVRLAGFMQAWGEAGDSFANDPPNANLSVLGKGEVTNTQVVLRNPTLNGSDLTYEIEILGGDKPGTGEAALFIDGLFDGSLLSSGAKGAGLGAIGGAIAGNAGEGAAIGAAVGIGGNLLKNASDDNQ